MVGDSFVLLATYQQCRTMVTIAKRLAERSWFWLSTYSEKWQWISWNKECDKYLSYKMVATYKVGQLT